MILCPNCQNHELTGALFCSECGAQLSVYNEMTTHPFIKDKLELTKDEQAANQPVNSQGIIDSAVVANGEVVRLLVVDSNKTINLSGRTEYTLGRVSTGQPIIPDVDLTEFEAYLQGVSRLHAALKIGRQRVSITDLGSANGTRVNGQKIIPHVDYPLKHGDAIALGKMKIKIAISTP